MKENLTKDQYLLPECRVVVVRMARVIAASTEQMNEEIETPWGA